MPLPRVFLDVRIGTTGGGRIIIQLFTDRVPKTCENFRSLCTSENPSQLTYRNSIFHRIIETFMVQGGDITKGDGTGGASIYNDGGVFEDEDLGWREIDEEGLVCMANRGKDTNNSQFFITLGSAEHLNGKHVVFGKVVKGMEVVREMEEVEVDDDDRPVEEVKIIHCGELEFKGGNVKKVKEPTRARSVSRSSSQPRSPSRSRPRNRSPSRSRSPSKSRSRSRSRHRSNRRHRSRRHRSSSRSRHHRRRSPSRSRSRSRRRHEKLDPKKMTNDDFFRERLQRRREDEERRQALRIQYQGDRWRPGQDEGRLGENGGAGGAGGAGEGGIKYKGRGKMRYRETGESSYGRLN